MPVTDMAYMAYMARHGTLRCRWEPAARGGSMRIVGWTERAGPPFQRDHSRRAVHAAALNPKEGFYSLADEVISSWAGLGCGRCPAEQRPVTQQARRAYPAPVPTPRHSLCGETVFFCLYKKSTHSGDIPLQLLSGERVGRRRGLVTEQPRSQTGGSFRHVRKTRRSSSYSS